MQISKNYRSPHFEDTLIPVEFAVLHYTAQSLKASLNIFLSQQSKVSCHLLIDRDGAVYELVDCLEGKAKKAFHAGQSLWRAEDKNWTGFNNFSIGIELVNWNGNLFPFTSEQYQSLFELLARLQTHFPQLRNPDRLLGHEQIAGFRGKKDPGCLFDWPYLFKNVYAVKNSDPIDSNDKKESYPKNLNSVCSKDEKSKDESLKTESGRAENQSNENPYGKKPEALKIKNNENQISEKTEELEAHSLKFEKLKLPLRKPVLTEREIEAIQFLKKSKKWNDLKAKRISLILENKLYPFWLKKYLLFFMYLADSLFFK